jgi:malonyl-CoA/methylmalonyl-CoA synthetase
VTPGPLLPAVADGDRDAVGVSGRRLTYGELREAGGELARRLPAGERVAVWATPSLETCIAVVAGILAGAAVVPIDPRAGPTYLHHVLSDSHPRAVLAGPGEDLPAILRAIPRIPVEATLPVRPRSRPQEPTDPEEPVFVIYTSGTTGRPKGVVIPRRAVASNIDALAQAWGWTARDVLVHSLPLFHVHGLILGLVGPLRVGSAVRLAAPFSPHRVAAELARGATMLFAVPTMYRDLADAAEREPGIAQGLGRARLLVSGSAPLPGREFHRLEASSGQRIVERYGLTETLMNCAERVSTKRRPGWVGPPLRGVDVRLEPVDPSGREEPVDGEPAEVLVRGPNLFLEYLRSPEATADAMAGGWFHTGDLAVRSADGWIRIVGRRFTDLITSGGYRIGAGEVEGALLEHPAVREAAVTAEPDDRLGERIVAWVVLRPGPQVPADVLVAHVAESLAPHKRPREIRFLGALPRNAMGKVIKAELRRSGGA